MRMPRVLDVEVAWVVRAPDRAVSMSRACALGLARISLVIGAVAVVVPCRWSVCLAGRAGVLVVAPCWLCKSCRSSCCLVCLAECTAWLVCSVWCAVRAGVLVEVPLVVVPCWRCGRRCCCEGCAALLGSSCPASWLVVSSCSCCGSSAASVSR